MSYCRWSDSHLYVFEDVGGYLICMSCPLMPPDESGFHENFTTNRRSEMISHLEEHKKRKEYSSDAVDRLKDEIQSEGDECKQITEKGK